MICHGQFKKPAKSVHAALGMGCETCHKQTEGMKHPQDKGGMKLSQDLPGLCYGCHDEKKFKGKFIHSPVAGGMCTSCHNPHQSDSPKLINGQIPAICFNCHENNKTVKKFVHAPTASGDCAYCHSPHASDFECLLVKNTNEICLTCHAQQGSGLHVVTGFAKRSHPVEGPKDPMRKGKPLTCASCHDPHNSDSIKLFRVKARNAFSICQPCHDK